ncbi:hypothetical protein M413DRAFT_447925 [Hebeloma cylindrosporum]|uniref:Uncharacterized protein n=1 Tax=Hebeloma cylindrosporum TaxID=76867 RepID=A0A0C3C3L5_HEBCY|nr:hypothetical protein M413DRAFT_447925 [Hebeloma cylindrosporum h7]
MIGKACTIRRISVCPKTTSAVGKSIIGDGTTFNSEVTLQARTPVIPPSFKTRPSSRDIVPIDLP